MIIILNPFAAAGTAMKKWDAVVQSNPGILRGAALEVLGQENPVEDIVLRALEHGERHFVAAGGDGTVNLLLEALLAALTPGRLKTAALGAIGLGSSNDFHKPVRKEQLLANVSCKVDFARALPRDVGMLSYRNGSPDNTRYFLTNASLGVTAEANDFFNHPDGLLSFGKRHMTSGAILYAAVRTITSYRNKSVTIDCAREGSFPARLTNLGIVKNPHFSGSLSYGGAPEYDDGLLKLYLSENMSRLQLLGLLKALGRKDPGRSRALRTWSTQEFTVSSKTSFAVEFDGEVIRTARARFEILHRHIKVCP